MNVLDLFAGLEGWSTPFRERGHRVFSTDFDPQFKVDLVKNILDITPDDIPFRPDIILASPPCEAFSVMNIGKNWTGPDADPPHQPKTDRAKLGLQILERTVWLIQWLRPSYFIIENPRAKMRKMPVMQQFDRRTVTYCQYGMRWQKPTDLWGGFPPSLILREMCQRGAPCHEAAPRGSSTGIQGKHSAEQRAVVPHQLSEQICIAAEADLAAGRPARNPYLFPNV
jgi:hypothetical protein